jgi:hypothetical protein
MEEELNKSILTLSNDIKKYVNEIKPIADRELLDKLDNIPANDDIEIFYVQLVDFARSITVGRNFHSMSRTFNDNIEKYKSKIQEDILACEVIYKKCIENIDQLTSFNKKSLSPLAVAWRMKFESIPDLLNDLLPPCDDIIPITYKCSNIDYDIKKLLSSKIKIGSGIDYNIVNNLKTIKIEKDIISRAKIHINPYEIRYELLLNEIIDASIVAPSEPDHNIVMILEHIDTLLLDTIKIDATTTLKQLHEILEHIDLAPIYKLVDRFIMSLSAGKQLPYNASREINISVKIIKFDVERRIRNFMKSIRMNESMVNKRALLIEFQPISVLEYVYPKKINYLLKR